VDDTINFFANFGNIEGQAKTMGQLFPTTNKAKDIVATFSKLLYDSGQDLWLESLVRAVDQVDGRFKVTIERNGIIESLHVPKVVIDSGRLPVAKLGASDFGLRVARQFE